MKEILDALKAKFEGVSESVLRIIAENLHGKGKSVDDVESVTFQHVIDSYGDHRATKAAETVRKKMEAESKPAQSQPEQGSESGVMVADDTPAWAKAILDAQKANAEAIARIQSEKVATERMEILKNTISKLPEELQSPYMAVPIDGMDQSNFDAFIEKITPQVEAVSVKLSAQAAAGEPASPGGSTTATVSDAMKARLNRMEKEAANQAPAVIGLESK